MLTHSAWWLIVDALAVYRLTILVVHDSITAPIRARLIGAERIRRIADGEGDGLPVVARPKLAVFLACPWCVSIWAAILAVTLTRFAPGAWQYLAVGLALSGVTGFLAERR